MSQVVVIGNPGQNGTSQPAVFFSAIVIVPKVVLNQFPVPFDQVLTLSPNVTTNNISFNIPFSGPYMVRFYAQTTGITNGLAQARFTIDNNGVEIFTISNETAIVTPGIAYTTVKADIELNLFAGSITLDNALNFPVSLGTSSTAIGNGTVVLAYLSVVSLFNPSI